MMGYIFPKKVQKLEVRENLSSISEKLLGKEKHRFRLQPSGADILWYQLITYRNGRCGIHLKSGNLQGVKRPFSRTLSKETLSQNTGATLRSRKKFGVRGLERRNESIGHYKTKNITYLPTI